MSGLFHRACDRCRSKKVRCKPAPGAACQHCQSHNLPCNFSAQKRRRRRDLHECAEALVKSTSDILPLLQAPILGPHSGTATEGYPYLYIDHLLERGPSREGYRATGSHDQLTTLLGPCPNISFFPAKKAHAISQRLGNNRLEHLLDAIRAVIASRLKGSSSLVGSAPGENSARSLPQAHGPIQGCSVKEYIQAYMDLVHPFYPYLCRSDFEKRAFAIDLVDDLGSNKAWACLYHAVIAVDCQHSDGGSYEARSGASWTYFERAVSYIQDLGMSRWSPTLVQSFMTLAIFCQSISGFGLESSMIAEAAVIAQAIGLNRPTPVSERSSSRTFWTLYYMEKTCCFTTGKVPTLQDAHVSCPLPEMAEWAFRDYDWFLSFIKYSRLVSNMHSELLTVSHGFKPWAACHATVKSLQLELDKWRETIPPRFRPGEPLLPRMLPESNAVAMALRAHYYYHYASLALNWTLLNFDRNGLHMREQLEMKTALMQTARSVLELTGYIEISPSTPLWILALAPLCALMILFDLVIHNPTHPETSLNLALLDVASGHFSRIEYASKGTLPGSLISEFAHLARQWILDNQNPVGRQTAFSLAQTASSFTQPLVNATFNPSNVPNTMLKDSSTPEIPESAVQYGRMGDSAPAPAESDIPALSTDPGQLFSPQTEGQLDLLDFLGVDLMGLFDPTYPSAGLDVYAHGNPHHPV